MHFLDMSSDAQVVICGACPPLNTLDSVGAVCHVTSTVGEQLPAGEMQSEMSETEALSAHQKTCQYLFMCDTLILTSVRLLRTDSDAAAL